MNVLILLNGTPPPQELLGRLAASHDLLFVTDGAVYAAGERGVSPDVVCGDFDSVSQETARRLFPLGELVPTPDQDFADGEKALRLARERGASSVTLTGTGGGRMDHALGHVALLLRYGGELPLRIREDGAEMRAISGADDAPGEWVVVTRPGDTISLLSLAGEARVTVSGVQWPLDDCLLPVGTQGVSNQATGEQVVIQVRGGTVIACHLFAEPGANAG